MVKDIHSIMFSFTYPNKAQTVLHKVMSMTSMTQTGRGRNFLDVDQGSKQ